MADGLGFGTTVGRQTQQACQQAADRLMAISNLKAEGLDNVLHK